MTNIAIIGATGNVGRKTLEVIEKKDIKFDNLFLVASSNSAGKKISFKGKDYEVHDLEKYDFSNANITFFAAGGKIAEQYAESAAKLTTVIDNSSFFRMDPDVPLIVPQVNAEKINEMKKNIVANPNCSTAQLVLALKPLHDLYKIKRVIVSTYQSVSGGGKAPMDELIEQTKSYLDGNSVESKNFTKQIAFNIIPHIDVFSDDGYTKEELKMTNETKKILDNNIELTATCVRIPVLVSHSESVNIEFENPYSLEQIREALNNADGCSVIDKRENGGYSTPIEATGSDETFISRIRDDKTKENSINLWIVSDNLLRGAALNSVEIAETIMKANQNGNNPLSPHIQIYRWHVSSLVSISHRITGIINILAITLICIFFIFFSFSEGSHEFIKLFLQSIIGKFFILGITWSFSFQILSEIRHLIMDFGYGFELKTTKITGLIVIFGSFILTVSIYLIGRNLF